MNVSRQVIKLKNTLNSQMVLCNYAVFFFTFFYRTYKR